MTYEYEPGQTPMPARQCVRCGKALEREVTPGGRTVGWFLKSHLDPATWVFSSRGSPPAGPKERWRCAECDRRYELVVPA